MLSKRHGKYQWDFRLILIGSDFRPRELGRSLGIGVFSRPAHWQLSQIPTPHDNVMNSIHGPTLHLAILFYKTKKKKKRGEKKIRSYKHLHFLHSHS